MRVGRQEWALQFGKTATTLSQGSSLSLGEWGAAEAQGTEFFKEMALEITTMSISANGAQYGLILKRGGVACNH